MNGGNVIFKFQGDGSGLNNSIGKINSTFGTMTKSILTATGITKAFDATLGMIKGSTGQAISRLDTLNKFPDVMKNLGVSAEDSQASIDLMAKKLQGLPTTLNDGAMAVQRFTSKNGDINKSTNYKKLLSSDLPVIHAAIHVFSLTAFISCDIISSNERIHWMPDHIVNFKF